MRRSEYHLKIYCEDLFGGPLLVITAAANAGLVKMLPEVLQEVRKLVGDRRVTVVFDRGGWSPKLFQKLLEANFDILTYRKGKSRRIAAQRFVVCRGRHGLGELRNGDGLTGKQIGDHLRNVCAALPPGVSRNGCSRGTRPSGEM